MERARPDVCSGGTGRAGARRCALRGVPSIVWEVEVKVFKIMQITSCRNLNILSDLYTAEYPVL